MNRILIALATAAALAGCMEDKNPYSFTEMKADAKLAFAENKACEDGQYDGKAWKADHCTQARSAFLVHKTLGRISPDGKTVKE